MGEKNNATYLHSALIVAWRGEIRARRLGMYCMNVSFHISQERRRQNWKLWKDHVEQKTWSSRPSGKSWRWPLWRWECERFGFLEMSNSLGWLCTAAFMCSEERLIPSSGQTGQHSSWGMMGLAQVTSSHTTSSQRMEPASHTQILHGMGFHTSRSANTWPS